MILVVGGSGRKVGKTSAIEALLRATPDGRWLAVKISGHAHGAHGWQLDRQEAPDAGTDSGRFLAAGAAEAWWLRCAPGRLAEAVPALRSLMDRFENVVLESNSIAAFLTADLHLFLTGEDDKRPAGAAVVCPPEKAPAEMIRFAAARLSPQAGR
jgi:hypothetical protein